MQSTNDSSFSFEESFEQEDFMRREIPSQNQDPEENFYINSDLKNRGQLITYISQKPTQQILSLEKILKREQKLSCSNLLLHVKALFRRIHQIAGIENGQFRYMREYFQHEVNQDTLEKKRKRYQGNLGDFREMMINYPLEMGLRPSLQELKRFMFRRNKLVYRILYNMCMEDFQELMYDPQNLKIQPTKCQRHKKLLRRVVKEVLEQRRIALE